MKKAATILALGIAVVFSNTVWAGNGGGGFKFHFGNGGNHHANNHHANNHHRFHHNQHHKLHHKFHHHNGRHRYGYVAPYFVPSIGYSTPPTPPIVLNNTNPINIINPAPAPAKVEKVPTAPVAKVEMGGTVRVTSPKIEDTGKGRAVLKVGHGYKRLVVVHHTDGLAVVELPALAHYKTEKPGVLMIFNGPGKLASKVPVTLVPADLSANVDGQFVETVQ